MNRIFLLLSIVILLVLVSLERAYSNNSEDDNSRTVLGFILLHQANSLDLKAMINELESEWNRAVYDIDTNETTAIFMIGAYKIALIHIAAPVPGNELAHAAEHNYFWKNAVEETAQHSAHIVISIMNSGIDPVRENILFTQIASCVMNNSKAIGIYIGDRTLVLKKDFYQDNVSSMSQEQLPLYLWIYFGFRAIDGKYSVYTYGLNKFGKKEIEILDTEKPFAELNGLITNIVHYILRFNVTLHAGETIGGSEKQKLKISESEGKFLEGRTLKIEF